MSMRVILSVTITGENEKSKLKHVVDKHSIDRNDTNNSFLKLKKMKNIWNFFKKIRREKTVLSNSRVMTKCILFYYFTLLMEYMDQLTYFDGSLEKGGATYYLNFKNLHPKNFIVALT